MVALFSVIVSWLVVLVVAVSGVCWFVVHVVSSFVLSVVVVGDLWRVLVLDTLDSVVGSDVVLLVVGLVVDWYLNIVLDMLVHNMARLFVVYVLTVFMDWLSVNDSLVDNWGLNVLNMALDFTVNNWLLTYVLNSLMVDWLVVGILNSLVVNWLVMSVLNSLVVDWLVMSVLNSLVVNRFVSVDDFLVVDWLVSVDDFLVVDWLVSVDDFLVDDWLVLVDDLLVVNDWRMMAVVFVVGSNCVVNWCRVVSSLSMVVSLIIGVVMSGWHVVVRNRVLHLSAHEDLGESKTNGMTVFIEVLILPLSLSVHDLVVDVLSVDNQVVLDMEDEVPWVSESL